MVLTRPTQYRCARHGDISIHSYNDDTGEYKVVLRNAGKAKMLQENEQKEIRIKEGRGDRGEDYKGP